MQRDLTISIVNHSNPELLRDCLRSIYASTRSVTFDVVVIDNATDGRIVAQMREEFPRVKWVFNKERLGFSANHNQALSECTSRYAAILNDDTVIQDGAFDALVRFLDEDPKAGMAGPRLLNPDGTIQDSTFRFMTLRSEWADVCILPGKIERLKRIGIDPAQNADVPAAVDWVLGACIVVRTEAMKQIGLLDEKLSPIANTEEVDWCYRANKAGWQVMFFPAAQVMHIGGQSMKRLAVGANMFRAEMYRTRLAFFAKHYGWMRTFMLRALYVASFPWNALMIKQSVLRGRTDRDRAASHLATLRAIAALAICPSEGR